MVLTTFAVDDLLPTIVDRRAAFHPDAIYAEYPKSPTSYEKGYEAITYGKLANAINGIAWWLTLTLGPGNHHEKLAYIGPNDLRYPVLCLGASKAGYCIFLTSPRNSVEAQLALFDRLHCTKLLTPVARPPPVTAILNARDMSVREVPEIDVLLRVKFPHFPFSRTLDQARSDPFIVLHTSGSTGIPKPIILTHDTVARHLRLISLRAPSGYDSQNDLFKGTRFFMNFPPFHAAGVGSILFYSILFKSTFIMPVSSAITTASGVIEGLKQTRPDIAFLVPSLIEEISQSPDILKYCAENLQGLVYCGGDLPDAIGDRVASRLPLYNHIGATEVGFLPGLLSRENRRPSDWKYVHLHPDSGATFTHRTDGQHELCIIRDPNKELHQPTFSLPGFTHLTEYGTRDLFVRNPSESKKDSWRWCARKDDILVLLNGEKTNPITMEHYITSSNEDVTGVLVVGAQRFQLALLIESRNTQGKSMTELIEDVWPSVEEANKATPSHARVAKSHILFTSPEKPMLRAGKGTIKRQATTSDYAKEINELYERAEKLVDVEGPGRDADPLAIKEFLRSCILSATQWNDLDNEDNLFIRGMDSLQTVMISRVLQEGLELAAITSSMIYASPSVSGLLKAIIQLRGGNTTQTDTAAEKKLQIRDEILQHYKHLIDSIPSQLSTVHTPSEHTVVLTGTTGVLGRYLLHTLLRNPSVQHVYCLNRRSSDTARQLSLTAQEDGSPMNTTRTSFLTVDLTQESLNLPPETLDRLRKDTTLVIHNAWPVNFNMPLASFDPQFAGIVNLIRFCTSATYLPRLLFISSISAMGETQASCRAISEQVHTIDTPGVNGYGDSKYISEHLLDHAAYRLPEMSFSVARVGQVAGAIHRHDIWNPQEWFPSLVRSSIHVGAVPDSLGSLMSRIDWVPVDLLAEVLVELAIDGKHPGPSHAAVFHPHNLHVRSWVSVRPVAVEAVRSVWGTEMDIVSVEEWLRRVQHGAPGDSESDLETRMKVNPGLKLLDFYQRALRGGDGDAGCSAFETKRTVESSKLLSRIPGVQDEWIWKWVGEWKEV